MMGLIRSLSLSNGSRLLEAAVELLCLSTVLSFLHPTKTLNILTCKLLRCYEEMERKTCG